MKRLIMIIAACLCLPLPAVAAEEAKTAYHTGTIDLEYRLSNISGSQAKANEYAPKGQGPRTSAQLDWGRELYQFRFDGAFNGNMSNHNPDGFRKYDFDFSGSFRKSDHYKIDAYAQQFGHHLSDGRTNSPGVGSTTLSARVPLSSNEFMYNRHRTNAGIGGEASFGSPFFASVKVDTQSVEGFQPNWFNGNIPYPVDYQVNTLTSQLGYRGDNLTMTLDGSVDSLTNDKREITNSQSSDNVRKPNPESKNYKVGGSLAWRMPELKSSLMVTGSFSNLTSDTIKSSRQYANNLPAFETRWDDYKGDIKNTNISAAFNTSPFKGFNAKVYTKYFERDNDSKVTWNPDANLSAADLLLHEARGQAAFYEYDKLTVGTELSQRFAGSYKIAAGYEFENTDRNRYGLTRVKETEDNKGWLQLNAGFTDMINGRLRYQYLDRDSSRTEDATLGTVINPSSGVIAPWFSYADTASKEQHQVRAGLDFAPLENLSFALDYVYTLDDYSKKQELGLNESTKHGILGDISYSIGPVKLNVYGGVEFGETKMDTRSYTSPANANPGNNPSFSNSNSTDNYNWNYTQKDTTYSLGVNSTVALIKDCLDLTVGYDFVENTGRTDISYPAGLGLDRNSIHPVDNYRQHILSAKLNYKVNQQHSFGLGYYYSKLNFSDWAYSDVTNENKLNDGYYNVSPSYEAHSVGLSYRYKF